MLEILSRACSLGATNGDGVVELGEKHRSGLWKNLEMMLWDVELWRQNSGSWQAVPLSKATIHLSTLSSQSKDRQESSSLFS